MARLSALVLAIGLTLLVGFPSGSLAQEPPHVFSTLIINANGDAEGLLAHAKQRKAALARVGSGGTMRVVQPVWGGPGPGRILVSVEYPSLAAVAAAQAKLAADEGWQALNAEFAAKPWVIESTSLLQDVTP